MVRANAGTLPSLSIDGFPVRLAERDAKGVSITVLAGQHRYAVGAGAFTDPASLTRDIRSFDGTGSIVVVMLPISSRTKDYATGVAAEAMSRCSRAHLCRVPLCGGGHVASVDGPIEEPVTIDRAPGIERRLGDFGLQLRGQIHIRIASAFRYDEYQIPTDSYENLDLSIVLSRTGSPRIVRTCWDGNL